MVKTKWSLEEPNISSAISKNKNNICAMDKCKNKLSNLPNF